MAAGDKSIRYSSYCVPQEQVSSGGKFYLDGDCGRKLSGNGTYTVGSSFVAPQITNVSATVAIAQDFVAIKALDIEEGSYVLISLDYNVSDPTDANIKYPIRLLKGECFASEIASTARVRIQICTATDGSGTGVGKVEYWSAITV